MQPDIDSTFKFTELEVRVIGSFSRDSVTNEPHRYGDGLHVLHAGKLLVTHIPSKITGEGCSFREALLDMAYNIKYAKEPNLRKIDLT